MKLAKFCESSFDSIIELADNYTLKEIQMYCEGYKDGADDYSGSASIMTLEELENELKEYNQTDEMYLEYQKAINKLKNLKKL